MKHSISILNALFAVLAFFVSCGGSEPGSIYGVVTDEATGEPVRNAGVELHFLGAGTIAARTAIGSDGFFYSPKVSEGEYSLLVTKPGYIENKSIVYVESGKETPYDVLLKKAPSALQIRIDGEEKSELDFGAEIDVVQRQFDIVNNGSEKLDWQISYSADWIKEVSPHEGSLQAQRTQGVVVTIDRNCLESGEQTTIISVTSNDGNKELTVKATNATVLPTLNTMEATSVDTDSAVLNGEILTHGVPEYTERGFVYSTSSLPTTENAIEQLTALLSDDEKYSTIATGLELGTTYYVRAYAINAAGIAYSTNVVSFKPHQVPPELKTEDPTNISVSSGTATFKGTIKYEGDPVYTERGFVYGHAHNPTVEDDTKKEVAGYGEGAFSIKVTELEINTIYYIRAYAINEVGIGYGNEIKLDFNAVKPIVYTKEPTNVSISGGTATFNGSIESVGDPAYTERGFVYGTVHNPTIEDDINKVVTGIGKGDFSVNITDLEMNNIYYIRAYAINSQGTTYGNEVTLDFNAVMPVVSTSTVTAINIAAGTATLNGKIDSIGDPAYTERGFVYATVHNPTVEDDIKKVATGNGTGSFYTNLTELEMNNIYYIRAYATNSQGTAYGNEVTLDFNPVPASVKTNAVLNVDTTKATLSGTINSLGDPAYTEKGFVYSKNPNPTTLNNKVAVSGSGSGIFTWNLTDLETRVTYYVKAYVISNNNVIYGNEVSFYTESPYYYVIAGNLIVAKEDAGKGPWDSAVDMCENSNLAGFTDWRLPTKSELLIAYNNKDLIGGFKDDWYWSSTTSEGYSGYAYQVGFSGGGVHTEDKSRSYYARCVKSINATVETNEVSNVDLTTATLNATITDEGYPAYTERGFVYAKTSNPTTSNNKIKVSGSGTGTFAYNLTGLETRVTYYVRSYLIANNNVVYGNGVSFYTESPLYYLLKESRLMVARNHAGSAEWSGAINLCNGSTLAGFTDWRLPTAGELAIIFDNKDLIGNFQDLLYWSSNACNDSEAYVVYDGGSFCCPKYQGEYVRCVRTAK